MLGAIAGAIGGALLGGLLSKGFKPSVSFSSYTPPHAQLGADVISQLLSKTPNLSQRITELRRPYIEEAIRSAEELEGKVADLYDALLSQTEGMVDAEMRKQSARLGALGLANTQAMQWTQADILDKMKLPIMKEKTGILAQILQSKPKLYADLSELITSTDKELLEFDLKRNLAQALLGVPSVVQPVVKQSLFDYLPSIATPLLTAFLLRR